MSLSVFASEYRKANTSKRSLLNGSAAVVGLSAGALGWSGLAQASGDEARLQTVLLPDHYSLQEDGVVVFSLTTGEQMSLSDGQYVILDGGLLLIVDELAQNAMTQLPVMGALRTELFMEFQPVRSPDGGIVEASDAQPLWTGEEAAPRLFEQVDIQRFELAQNGSESETQSETNSVSVAAGGLSLAGLSLASGIIGTEPEAAAEEEEPSAPAPAPAAPSEYLSNTMFQELTPTTARAFTGSAGDSFIGYSSASTTTQDALVDAGRGFGNSATFDMLAGGDNLLLAGDNAARSSGALVYRGGSGDDSLTFGTFLANNGFAFFDMSADGNNTLVAGTTAASPPDFPPFGGAASGGGQLSYTGGSGDDSLTFGNALAFYGNATIDMSEGGNNTFVADKYAAANYGGLSYRGGSGVDSLTFGDELANLVGIATIDLGSDSAIDTVTFEGSVGPLGGYVTIINFDPSDGDTIVLQRFSFASDVTTSSTPSSTGSSNTDTLVTGVAGTSVNFLISGVTPNSISLTTNSSDYLVITADSST